MASHEARIHPQDEAAPRSSRPSGRRGGRGGRPEGREVQLSKALSRLLRHQAENAGIKLDEEGFAPLDRLSWGPIKSLSPSLQEVKDVVETNAKKRFTLRPADPLAPEPPSAAGYLIRANQGHSLKVDEAALFEPILLGAADLPGKVVHGTYFAFWKAILESGGLKPMSRGHIHCSDRTPEEGAVSGMRRDAELLVEIDIEASLKDGVTWWRSDNGVILTDGGEGGVLETKYFKMVTSRTTDLGVLWEDGVKIADLPADLKFRAPGGKRPGGRRGGGEGGGGRHRRS
ncbi:RNA 2'-phosphotransferase domain protein [Metarhizium robertsii]|uniref:2'-phosphotransferase n=2 Tax=Metarhizium robertsii TaxID=568076 RepID=E9F0P5_METRA|nr:RNA 2'-phosphotransferase [Metarhizium robertsii ARSEF 23]EFY98705.1 RNA 2'-phosphotransferase [Metarhizium robertsii ARSEF 23]EXV04139.1 RNA 2'-phosphotransferase domain protein [Metarhizium robertsii]